MAVSGTTPTQARITTYTRTFEQRVDHVADQLEQFTRLENVPEAIVEQFREQANRRSNEAIEPNLIHIVRTVLTDNGVPRSKAVLLTRGVSVPR